MKSLLALAAILTLSAVFLLRSGDLSPFEAWKAEHGITYAESEDSFRKFVFLKNLATINAHNSIPDSSYKLGLNKFAALTSEEFVSFLLRPSSTAPRTLPAEEGLSAASIDWTGKGLLTKIKDQGSCGSCWAFSSTGSLEALYVQKGNTLTSFSEQQLVDCSRSYGNQGCNGGLEVDAFKYTKDKGIASETAYPYTAKDSNCKSFTPVFKNTGYKEVAGCNNLYSALVGRPFAVGVDATNWHLYKSGIFNNCKTNINHGVLLVGYTDTYWTIKNSWGTGWGENGFVRLAPGNTCAVCNQGVYPTA